MCCAVYRSDPDPLPDTAFEPGVIAHLVEGNTGRLLDARRTPVRLGPVRMSDGMFEVQVAGFEDAGAIWEIPFEDVGRYQFAAGAARASAAQIAAMERVAAHLAAPLRIEPQAGAAAGARERIGREQETAAGWLAERMPGGVDLRARISAREGDRHLMGLLEEYLERRGLIGIERLFTRAWVSNPLAGEMVKCHAIVLAELGLCPFEGKAIRDPAAMSGELSRELRSQHLVARLTFSGALWGAIGRGVATYRAFSSETALTRPGPASLVSATLSSEVALAHFAGGPRTRSAAIWRSPLDPARVLMSFLETEAMNRQYREAEVVLTGGPAARAEQV